MRSGAMRERSGVVGGPGLILLLLLFLLSVAASLLSLPAPDRGGARLCRGDAVRLTTRRVLDSSRVLLVLVRSRSFMGDGVWAMGGVGKGRGSRAPPK